jgi:hypothetical protein
VIQYQLFYTALKASTSLYTGIFYDFYRREVKCLRGFFMKTIIILFLFSSISFSFADYSFKKVISNKEPKLLAIDNKSQNNDILHRRLLDYSFTKETLYIKIINTLGPYALDRLQYWLDNDYFDYIVYNGTNYFFNGSIPNLFYEHHDLRELRLDKNYIINNTKYAEFLLKNIRLIWEESVKKKTNIVMPVTIQGQMNL